MLFRSNPFLVAGDPLDVRGVVEEKPGRLRIGEVASAEEDSVIAGKGSDNVFQFGPADVLYRTDHLPLAVAGEIGDLGPAVHSVVVSGNGVFQTLGVLEYGIAEQRVVPGTFFPGTVGSGVGFLGVRFSCSKNGLTDSS